jgi:hypothetical protein
MDDNHASTDYPNEYISIDLGADTTHQRYEQHIDIVDEVRYG